MNDAGPWRNLLNCMLYQKMLKACGRTEGWKICCWKWPYVNLICFVYRNVGVLTGEECIESVHGDLVYLSGGCMYRGVGVVVVSAQFRKRLEHASFSCLWSPGLCAQILCWEH